MVNAQSIKIYNDPEIEAQGVTLIPATSPEAGQHLSHISSDNMLHVKTLLPYSVILVNNSSRRLLGTAVSYSYPDPYVPGHTIYQVRAIYDFNEGPDFPFSGMMPGEGRLYTYDQSLNLYFVRLKAAPHLTDPNALMQFSTLIDGAFRKVKSHDYTVMIDCVVLEGIGPIGPDHLNLKEQGFNRRTTYNAGEAAAFPGPGGCS